MVSECCPSFQVHPFLESPVPITNAFRLHHKRFVQEMMDTEPISSADSTRAGILQIPGRRIKDIAGLKGVLTGTPLHRPWYEPRGRVQSVYSHTGSCTGREKQTQLLALPQKDPRSCRQCSCGRMGKHQSPH